MGAGQRGCRSHGGPFARPHRGRLRTAPPRLSSALRVRGLAAPTGRDPPSSHGAPCLRPRRLLSKLPWGGACGPPLRACPLPSACGLALRGVLPRRQDGYVVDTLTNRNGGGRGRRAPSLPCCRPLLQLNLWPQVHPVRHVNPSGRNPLHRLQPIPPAACHCVVAQPLVASSYAAAALPPPVETP